MCYVILERSTWPIHGAILAIEWTSGNWQESVFNNKKQDLSVTITRPCPYHWFYSQFWLTIRVAYCNTSVGQRVEVIKCNSSTQQLTRLQTSWSSTVHLVLLSRSWKHTSVYNSLTQLFTKTPAFSSFFQFFITRPVSSSSFYSNFFSSASSSFFEEQLALFFPSDSSVNFYK